MPATNDQSVSSIRDCTERGLQGLRVLSGWLKHDGFRSDFIFKDENTGAWYVRRSQALASQKQTPVRQLILPLSELLRLTAALPAEHHAVAGGEVMDSNAVSSVPLTPCVKSRRFLCSK